jgi:hypothetical protein
MIWKEGDEMPAGAKAKLKIKYNGEELTVSQAAKKTGLDEYIIRNRIHMGWSPEKIIETPARRVRKYQQRTDAIQAKKDKCDMMRTHDYRACFECKHQDCICWGCVPQQKCEPNIKDYIRGNDIDRKKPDQEIIHKIVRPASEW